ncbi:MAG: SAM-dependent methyltransferase [Ruminococcaceae bacterium]|nr:SAM-dependent methyltransferase [Oscillospiraceae bacterium]
MNTPFERLCDLIYRCAVASMMDKTVLSKCHDKTVQRCTLTLRRIKGEIMIQAETMRTATVAKVAGKGEPVQASHENLPLNPKGKAKLTELLGQFDQVNIMTPAGNCEFRRSKNGKETLLGASPVYAALDKGQDSPARLPVFGNDKQKNRILSGAEPFLIHLGVSDERGRVHDKKQPKFRQINRFLELIRDVEHHLPSEGILNICDLCCGKSYLSFAVYHYFTALQKRTVRMVGVDMKAEVMEDCNIIAKALGMDGLSFVCADVNSFDFGAPVHMVISLHACDTATDLVLNKALDWGTKIILSTPCCHHAMNKALDCPALSFIAEHSMLKQKLCDAATDALRLKRLEANGYDVTALELIDPEETPKNVMLRGIKKYDPRAARCKKAADEYKTAYEFLMGKSPEEV